MFSSFGGAKVRSACDNASRTKRLCQSQKSYLCPHCTELVSNTPQLVSEHQSKCHSFCLECASKFDSKVDLHRHQSECVPKDQLARYDHLPLHLYLRVYETEGLLPSQKLLTYEDFLRSQLSLQDDDGDTVFHRLCRDLLKLGQYFNEPASPSQQDLRKVDLFNALLRLGADVFQKNNFDEMAFEYLFSLHSMGWSYRYYDFCNEMFPFFEEVTKRFCQLPSDSQVNPNPGLLHIAAIMRPSEAREACIAALLSRSKDALLKAVRQDPKRTPIHFAFKCDEALANRWLHELDVYCTPSSEDRHLFLQLLSSLLQEYTHIGPDEDEDYWKQPAPVHYLLLKLGGKSLMHQLPLEGLLLSHVDDALFRLVFIHALAAGVQLETAVFARLLCKAATNGFMQSLEVLLSHPLIEEIDTTLPMHAGESGRGRISCLLNPWYSDECTELVMPKSSLAFSSNDSRHRVDIECRVMETLLFHHSLAPRLTLTPHLLRNRVSNVPSENRDYDMQFHIDRRQGLTAVVKRMLELFPQVSFILPIPPPTLQQQSQSSSSSSSSTELPVLETMLDFVFNCDVLFMLLNDSRCKEAFQKLLENAPNVMPDYLSLKKLTVEETWIRCLDRHRPVSKSDRWFRRPEYLAPHDPLHKVDKISQLFMDKGNTWCELWCVLFSERLCADFSKYVDRRSVFRITNWVRPADETQLQAILARPYYRAHHRFLQPWVDQLRSHLSSIEQFESLNNDLPNLMLTFLLGDDLEAHNLPVLAPTEADSVIPDVWENLLSASANAPQKSSY